MKMRVITPFALIMTVWLALVPAAQAVEPIEEANLSNGMRVLLMQAHNVPMVAMQLNVAAGSAFDPDGRGGAATLMAAMLGDHTARHDNIAWADLLDRNAVQFGVSASTDSMGFSLTVLKEALVPGLDALAEAVTAPGWDARRFAIIKQDTLSALKKEQEEPGVRASEATRSMLYGDHPYGHRSVGTIASLEAVTLKGLKQLYAAQLQPEGAVLAVSGDITMDELLALLKPRLSGWHGKPVRTLAGITPAKAVAGQSVDVEMPTSQTMVQLSRLGPARSDAAFFPAFVLNHLLGGGGFGSRLMEEVREKRGLVYGVYSYFSPLQVPGPFVISLQTRGDQAEQAESVVRQVLAEIAVGKIDAKQLHETRENLMGSFAQRMDSNRERVGLISMIGIYQLPLDYLSVWESRVDAVTLEQVKAQAARFLKPESWNRVRVGKALR